MSCYLIRVENGHKVARSITSQEEYKQIRGSYGAEGKFATGSRRK